MTCSLGNLSGASSATITIAVTLTTRGTLSATATATNVVSDSDDSGMATSQVQGS